MERINMLSKTLIVTSLVAALTACGGGSGGGGGTSASAGESDPVQQFSVKVTDIQLTRVSRNETVAVDVTGVESETLTYQD